METIKRFISQFLEKEAIAKYRRLKPDMGAYNIAYESMNAYTIGALTDQLGLIKMTKLNDGSFYKRYKNTKPFNPRHLYKISYYKHNKYQDVFIAYVSESNPDIDFKEMGYAFFIIKEEEKYLIAKKYIYSNKIISGGEYIWNAQEGYNDLTFDTLGDFIETVRYLEPEDDDDSMKIYLEEK